MPPAPLLELDRVSIRHEGAARATPVDVSFTVARGEVVLLLGPSGCGKSTLTLALDGLVPHAVPAELAGTVRIAGLDSREHPVGVLSEHVAMVFQDPDAQIVTGTVLDEVCFAPENQLAPASEVLERAERALKLVGLWNRRTENPDRLSGGGRQRLAIACALAMAAPVLVLDEPTANLDPAGIDEVYAVLRELANERDHAVVLVEHNLDAAVDLVDRVIVLDAEGRLVIDGPARETLRSRADELVELGVWLPVSTLAAMRLRTAGVALDPLPLTPSELGAALDAQPVLPAPLSESSPVRSTALSPRPTLMPLVGAESLSSSRGTGRTDEGPLRQAQGTGRTDEGPLRQAQGTGRADEGSLRQAQGTGRADEGSLRQAQGTGRADEGSLRQAQGTGQAQGAVAIRARGLSVRRGGRRGRVVVHDVDLDVASGDFLAIVGTNGAGKTSLLQALAGVTAAPHDAVSVLGVDPSRADARELAQRIGFVFQNPEHQFIAPTVGEELAQGLRLQGVDEAAIGTAVDRMLRRFGLEELREQHPFLLSGGQKRRLSVGTALIAGAPVLALDEPTFGQDRARASEILDMLRALNDEGTTVLVVTHDLQLVADYASHIAVMSEGRLLGVGPAAEVLAGPLVEQAGLRHPPLARATRGLERHPAWHAVTRMSQLPVTSGAAT